jgi:hypothetical protein
MQAKAAVFVPANLYGREINPLPEAVLKIPYRDRSPASMGTNPLERLTLPHAPSTNTGFRGERSLGRTLPRIGKRRATFRTCQARLDFSFITLVCQWVWIFRTASV